MASAPTTPNSPGASRKIGRFETERVLGRGGMGTVYLARDPVIGRLLAIKQIRPEPTTDAKYREEMRARFALEFRSAGTLSHPNVVTIYDVGQAQETYFIAMEYIEGETLAQRVARAPRLELQETIGLARQIAAGLDYAHGRGIVHRDVKPGNVLLTANGHAKITDFGLAKFLSTEVTQTGTLLGTPAFMAPEQVLGQPVSPRSDQFSFAVILYLMLTGDTPFGSEHPSSILYKIVNDEPAPPRRVNQRLPAAVDRVLLRALSKRPEQRFESCDALVEALAAALNEVPDSGEPTLRLSDPRLGDPRLGDPRLGDPRLGDPRLGDPRLGDLPLPPTAPAGTPPTAPTPELAFETAAPQVLADRIRAAKSARPSRRRWLVLAGALGALTFAAYLAPSFLGSAPAVTPPPASVTPPPPAAPPPTAEPAAPPPAVPPAAPVPEPVTLEVASEPAGARILLEGNDTGLRTPAKIAFEPGREHRIGLRLDGYEQAGRRFTLDQLSETQRARAQLFFPLTPEIPPATVVVEAPYGVELAIGGRRWPAATRHEVAVPPGKHQVTLVAADVFFRQTKALELASGQKVELNVPRTALVNVSANPANCQVSIDGRVVDYTPILDLAIVVGQHQLTFDWPALGRKKNLDVTISRDQQRIYANANE